MSRPLIVGHRGASYLAPENTLVSFRTAKALGADGIEMDVQMTKDKKLVIAHDYLTDIHAGVRGDIYNMTFDELRQLDFGAWKGAEYAGEKIPTLEEVLEIGRDMKMMHIELKPYLARDADFVERVIDTIVDAGCVDKVVLTSFQYGLLQQVKERMPEIPTCALSLNSESSLIPPPSLWEDLGLANGDPLLEKLSGAQNLNEALAIANDPELEEENCTLVYHMRDRLTALFSNYPGKNLAEIMLDFYRQTDWVNYVSQFDFPVDYTGPEYHVCFRDPTLLDRARAKGYGVAPWPVGTEDRRSLRSILALNPDIIVTNRPEDVISILESPNFSENS